MKFIYQESNEKRAGEDIIYNNARTHGNIPLTHFTITQKQLDKTSYVTDMDNLSTSTLSN